MRDLQKDLEICNKATPGPWIHRNGVLPEVVILEKEEAFNLVAECPGNINAAFIAASREGWPEAIERAIKAEAELAKTRRALELACRQISDYALPTGTETMKDKLAAGRYDVFLKEGAK